LAITLKKSCLLMTLLIGSISFVNKSPIQAQCTSTEVQLEISYTAFGTSINGDAIRISNSSSQVILYCQEFGQNNFVDTLCVPESTSIDIYGYDIQGENWGEATLILRYINDPSDCGPSSDSTLVDIFTNLDGMGQMICGAMITKDVFLDNFTTPDVFCSGSEPECITDTIFLTLMPGVSNVEVDFLDFVTDDGNLNFNFALDQMTDFPF